MELDEQSLKQFYNHCSSSIRRGDVFTGRQLLEFLRSTKLIPAPPQKLDSTALGKLMQDYERFLRSECGPRPLYGEWLSTDRTKIPDRTIQG